MRRSLHDARRGGLPVVLALLAVCAGEVGAQAPSCVLVDQPKLRLRKLDDGVGNERVLFRGAWDIDESIALDLVATGLIFRMTDASGAPFLDVTLPPGEFTGGGSGWEAKGTGVVWNWRDRFGEVSGFRRVSVKRKLRTGPFGGANTRVVLFGQDFSYPLPTLPITVEVLIPNPGTSSLCGAFIAEETSCFFRNLGNKLICK